MVASWGRTVKRRGPSKGQTRMVDALNQAKANGHGAAKRAAATRAPVRGLVSIASIAPAKPLSGMLHPKSVVSLFCPPGARRAQAGLSGAHVPLSCNAV